MLRGVLGGFDLEFLGFVVWFVYFGSLEGLKWFVEFWRGLVRFGAALEISLRFGGDFGSRGS